MVANLSVHNKPHKGFKMFSFFIQYVKMWLSDLIHAFWI